MPLPFKMMMAASGVRPTLPYTTNLFQHYRADLINVTESSSLVSQWNDLSGNSHDLTESTNKPLWVAGLANGYPAIRFDGSNDQLSVSLTGPNGAHIFLVWNQVSWTFIDVAYNYPDDTGDFYIMQNNVSPKINLDSGYGYYIAGPSIGSFGLSILLHSTTDATSSIALNDGAPSTVTARSSSKAGTFYMGCYNGSLYFCNFEVAEMIVYDTPVTGDDLTTVKTYINDQYSLW